MLSFLLIRILILEPFNSCRFLPLPLATDSPSIRAVPDGASTLDNIDRTISDAESVRFQLISDAQDIALEVAKIYLDALKAHEVLALSESNLAVHKEIHSDIKKRVDSGIGSTADLSQVEARLAKAHGNLVAAQNNLFDVHTTFKKVVG